MQSGDHAVQSIARERAKPPARAGGEREESRAAGLSKSLELNWIKYDMKLYPKLYSNCLPPPATVES